MNDMIHNPYRTDADDARPSAGGIVSIEQQRAVAEVQARMIIARANPREPIRCMDRILQDCTRPSLAEEALYQYARGGTSISGPSIRLAESIARQWGNIASGIKEVSRSDGYSECVAYAWDLETGYYDERVFQVRHWRDTKGGGYKLTDERDIYELIANLGQRRKRAVLLTVLPGDVVEAARQQCEQTLSANADTSPEALKKVLAAFAEFNVTQGQIEARCQCHLQAIRPAQVVQLRKIYASLKDGMSTAPDWFPAAAAPAADGKPEEKPAGNAALKRKLKKDAPQQPQEGAAAGDGPDGHEDAGDATDASGPQPGVADEDVSAEAEDAERRALAEKALGRIADGLVKDIDACKSADDLKAWDRNESVRKLLKRLEDEGSVHWQRVNGHAQEKMVELKNGAQP